MHQVVYEECSLTEKRLSGAEAFHLGSEALPVKVSSFWQWSASDLLDNAQRGKLAEFLVGTALGCLDERRKEWDAFDLLTADGIKIEVKSAAYVQTWHQSAPSKISFRIKPTQAWDASTNKWASESRRTANVYVFCVLSEQDATRVDPLNLDQWDFYVVGTGTLDNAVGQQASITIGRLLTLNPISVDYARLPEAVRQAAEMGTK